MEEIDNSNKINEENLEIKIILIGKKGAGKTSIKSLIFQNKSPQDTLKLDSTNEIEETHLNFINNMHLRILDLSSKDDYSKQYFTTKKEIIFSKVDVLIFVTQQENNPKEKNEELTYFEK